MNQINSGSEFELGFDRRCDTQSNDIQHTGTQHDSTQHKGLNKIVREY
jgi:hypothetical protein